MRYGLIIFILASCATPATETPQADSARQAAAQTAPPPSPTARTVAQFDTTTVDQRDAAQDVQPQARSGTLGTSIATLGDPADPGIWVKTPLVDQVADGQVTYQGQTIAVQLRPLDAPSGSGSQISLAAMRLINAPLTGLIEVTLSTAG